MGKPQQEIKIQQRYWLLLQCQFWFFHLFIAALAAYIIAQISFIDQSTADIYTTDDYRYSLQAIDLWKRGYIIDIKVVNTDNCPQAYEPVINYTWPGTQTGCYCSALVETHKFEYIMLGDCSGELIDYGCRTVSEIGPQLMKMWKGGKLLCYKRAEYLNFYNSLEQKTSDGTILKKCAVGSSYQLNTLPEISCPVTSISNLTISSTQEELSLATLESLFYENQLDYPIADFKLTQYQFCPFFDQINISPDKNGNYLLQINNYSVTCEGKDPRMHEFDYLNEEQFLTNNTRIYDLIEELPGYPKPSPNFAYRLGFIRYPAWTHECRVSETHKIADAKNHLDFKYIGENIKFLIYVGVPCLIIIAVLLRGYYIIRHIFQLQAKKQFNMLLMSDEDVVEQIPNLNLIKSSTKESFLLLAEVLLIGGTIYVFIMNTMLFLEESRWIKQSFQLACTDEHLQGIFYLYENLVDNQRFEINRCVFFCALMFVVELTHFGIRVFHGDLKGKEVVEEKPDSANELLRDEIIIDKQLKIEKNSGIYMQDSSQILLNMDRNDEKVYDIDNMMQNDLQIIGQQTNYNFFSGPSIQADQMGTLSKKKKKKKGIKRKNLFKDDENK